MSVGNCRLCGRVSKDLDADGYCPNEEEDPHESEEATIARERAIEEHDIGTWADIKYAELKDK